MIEFLNGFFVGGGFDSLLKFDMGTFVKDVIGAIGGLDFGSLGGL